MTKNLFIGGMVAGGFDATGKYLLVVSHAGRGVFATDGWQRTARDSALAYPESGVAIGIGPIEGERIAVHQIDYATGVLKFSSPDGRWSLRYAEGTLEVESQIVTNDSHTESRIYSSEDSHHRSSDRGVRVSRRTHRRTYRCPGCCGCTVGTA